MSNRPKGFKRMPIFYVTGFDRNDKPIIKGFDELLPMNEYYRRLIKGIRYGGRMKAKKIYDTLKFRTKRNLSFRW